DDAGKKGVSETRWFEIIQNQPPEVILYGPANNTQFTTQNINFTFKAIDDLSSTLNCSIYLDNALNQTNPSTQNNTLTNFSISGISYGSHNWYINCSDGKRWNISETRNFVISQQIQNQPPKVTLNAPANNTEFIAVNGYANVTFNFTATDDNWQYFSCSIYLDERINQTNESVKNSTTTLFKINGIA
ncbi:MAG: hypothetical protein ACP5KK_03475, partial [Candidatus Nanoarchaeia archaeon]